MSNTTTVARPYAKAIFEYALAANSLTQWSQILHKLALALSDEKTKQFLVNPAVSIENQVELLLDLFLKIDPKEKVGINNLIRLLAKNKRLLLLPEINILFEALRAEQEKTIEVNIISYSGLSREQEEQLNKSLTERLQRQVTLNLRIDKSILGGAIIYAGDLIIDGSVLGRLNKLRTYLAA